MQQGGVFWNHEDPITKSKRVTDVNGNVVSMVELDPWGADTPRSSNSAFQPQNFTSYIRDGNGQQDAMARRYSPAGRFSQPDPYSGSYDFSDPQSLNRYAYTKNDPVNFRDPSGLGIMSVLRAIGRWLKEPKGSRGGPGGPSSDVGGMGVVEEEEGGEPQNPFASGSSEDPCAHLLPANIPPGVSVDEDMRVAENLYRQATRPIADLGGTGARGAQPLVIFMDFYNRVKTGGPWDYKQRDQEGIRLTGRSKYEEFGNFVFGATGAAERIPTGALLRGAGFAQQQDHNPDVRAAGRGTAVNGWSEIFSNKGTYPYGDEPSDSAAIQRGVDYYNCRREHPR